jgi:hypothetical protein
MLSNDRLKNEGLEPTLSNDWLKNEGLEPTLLNDWLKIRAGTDIVDSSSHFPTIGAQHCPQQLCCFMPKATCSTSRLP